MNTNITKLKQGKGVPPTIDCAPDVIDDRAKRPALRPLQVRIPTDVFEEFSEQAGREFGFSHGAKKRMFLKIWETYKAQNM